MPRKKDYFMRGLVLEGGGARGAYQIGVVKAFYENGYSFDGFVGTSIGAINAAMLAQGDFEKSLELWMHISLEQVFYEDELSLVGLTDIKGHKTDFFHAISEGFHVLDSIIHNRGFHTDKMKALLEQFLDEEKIRKSGKDYGLVALSLSKHKSYELMLEDIPDGQLIDYIMASASMPGFHPETVAGNTFLDGGLSNNCPFNLLSEKKDYDEIVVVRITKIPLFRKTDDPRVKFITPNENLGNPLMFTSENSKAKIELGYNDGLRYILSL